MIDWKVLLIFFFWFIWQLLIICAILDRFVIFIFMVLILRYFFILILGTCVRCLGWWCVYDTIEPFIKNKHSLIFLFIHLWQKYRRYFEWFFMIYIVWKGKVIVEIIFVWFVYKMVFVKLTCLTFKKLLFLFWMKWVDLLEILRIFLRSSCIRNLLRKLSKDSDLLRFRIEQRLETRCPLSKYTILL